MEKVKVLVVDDSAFMRKMITDMLASDPQIEVLGTARNGVDAWEKIKQLKPDIITLDVEMPQMDGLQLLERLMSENPLPVIMLSSLTQHGAEATIRALSLGAVDFISKPSGSISLDIEKVKAELINKVKMGAKVNTSRVRTKTTDQKKIGPAVFSKQEVPYSPKFQTSLSLPKGNVNKIIAIGTSTGGPRALQEVIPRLPEDLPAAVLIVQHMPKGFTHSLAQRLNQQSKIRVKEGEQGDKIENGLAILAPGGYHMTLEKGGIIGLNQEPPVWGVRPAVDVLFKSIAENYPAQVVTVILTGMGHDGAAGVAILKEKNAKSIAEDKSTCVVYGMPKSVVDKGLADKVLPLSQVAVGIIQLIQSK